MAEPATTPPPQSALEALARRPRTTTEVATVSLHERHHLRIRQIAAWRDGEVAALRAALDGPLGLEPPAGLDAAGQGDRLILPTALRRWWLVEDDRSAATGLESALAGMAALTDLSHGRTVLRLGGAAAGDVLAKLCRIDLHQRALPTGRVVQTALAQVPALIHALGPAGFDLYLPRSLAISAAASVIDAAEEFGVAFE